MPPAGRWLHEHDSAVRWRYRVSSAAEDTGREIDLAVRNLVEAGDAAARKILDEHRAELEAGVELLIANESLTAEQFAPLRAKDATSGQVAA